MQFEKIRLFFDFYTEGALRKFSIPILRMSMGTVYCWFGLLKIADVSPIAPLIKTAYFFLPYPASLIILGIWEFLIGLGLISNQCLRVATVSLWFQMLGIIVSAVITPSIYFNSAFELTLEGEFLIKNAILIAASFVIISHKDHVIERPVKANE